MTSLRVLRHKDFGNLWVGQAISQLGDALYFLVFMFMVDRMTKNPAAVGGVMIIQALPFLLISPFAGVLADRMDRRNIMLFCDISSGVALLAAGAFVLSGGALGLPIIYLLAAGLSVINSFFLPAKSAAIPRLVPPEDLAEANGLSNATAGMMPMIGLALSSIVLGAIEQAQPQLFFSLALIVNALSFLGSAIFVRRVPPIPVDREGVPPHVIKDLVEGGRYVWHQPFIRTVYLMQIGISFFVAPFFMVYLQTNREWFGGRFQTLAIIELSFLVLMVVFNLLIPRFKVTRPGVSLMVAIFLLGSFILVMGNTRVFGWYVLWNALCGVVLPFGEIPTSTHIQQLSSDELRGRVNAVNGIVRQGIYPISILIFTALAPRVGLVGMYWLMGGGMALSAFAGFTSREFVMTKTEAPATTE